MVLQQYPDTTLSYHDIDNNDDDYRSTPASPIAGSPIQLNTFNYRIKDVTVSIESLDVPTPLQRATSAKDWYRSDDEGERVQHLIVLQHGYMGVPGDMKLLKRHLSLLLLDPDTDDESMQVLYFTSSYLTSLHFT